MISEPGENEAEEANVKSCNKLLPGIETVKILLLGRRKKKLGKSSQADRLG